MIYQIREFGTSKNPAPYFKAVRQNQNGPAESILCPIWQSPRFSETVTLAIQTQDGDTQVLVPTKDWCKFEDELNWAHGYATSSAII